MLAYQMHFWMRHVIQQFTRDLPRLVNLLYRAQILVVAEVLFNGLVAWSSLQAELSSLESI